LRTYSIIASIIVVCLLTYIIFFDKIINYKRSNYKRSNDTILIEYEKELQKKIRLDNMAQSLIIAFNISKWEAKYYSIIYDDFTQRYEIPWEIYACIFRIESNFKTTLKSNEGAKGIGQILESTGEELCRKLDISYVENQTLWNDLLNKILSCYYLTEGICDSVYKDSTIEVKLLHGVKRYLGGPAYPVSIKKNETTKVYVSDYKTTVWREYSKLTYIYKGVVADTNKVPLAFFK